VSGGDAGESGVAASDCQTAATAVASASQLAHAVNPAALGYYLLPGYQSPYSGVFDVYSSPCVTVRTGTVSEKQ